MIDGRNIDVLDKKIPVNYHDDQRDCYYLREYLNYRTANEMKNNSDCVSEAENEPLTWDELKAMKGKPVWVEDNLDVPEDITKYWAVVKKFEKAECCEYVVLDDLCYGKREHGKVWQAYRKER